MTVRFFGGWDFVEGDAEASDIATSGYDKGVPMGGDPAAAGRQAASTFLVAATKDPEAATSTASGSSRAGSMRRARARRSLRRGLVR